MKVEQEIKRLWKALNNLAERLMELESDDDDSGETSAIGFEVDASDDFDEDESEY